jgi:hypothetical protein
MSVRYMQSPLALSRRVSHEWLLALPDRDEIDTVNGTGATLWELLKTPGTAADLSKALGEIYETSSQAIDLDVSRFLSALSERRLVERLIDDE